MLLGGDAAPNAAACVRLSGSSVPESVLRGGGVAPVCCCWLDVVACLLVRSCCAELRSSERARSVSSSSSTACTGRSAASGGSITGVLCPLLLLSCVCVAVAVLDTLAGAGSAAAGLLLSSAPRPLPPLVDGSLADDADTLAETLSCAAELSGPAQGSVHAEARACAAMRAACMSSTLSVASSELLRCCCCCCLGSLGREPDCCCESARLLCSVADNLQASTRVCT